MKKGRRYIASLQLLYLLKGTGKVILSIGQYFAILPPTNCTSFNGVLHLGHIEGTPFVKLEATFTARVEALISASFSDSPAAINALFKFSFSSFIFYYLPIDRLHPSPEHEFTPPLEAFKDPIVFPIPIPAKPVKFPRSDASVKNKSSKSG